MARAEFTRAELAAAIYGTTLSVEETRAYINRAFGRTQDAALLTADRMFVLHAGVRQHVFGKLATLLSPRNVTVTGKDGAFDIPVTVYADVFARVPEARVLVASAPCGAGKTNAVVAYVNDPRLPLPVACDGRVCVRALFVASRIAEVEKLYADIVRSCPWMRSPSCLWFPGWTSRFRNWQWSCSQRFARSRQRFEPQQSTWRLE